MWHLTGDMGQKIAPPSRLEPASVLEDDAVEVFVEIKFAHVPEQSTLALPDGTILWNWKESGKTVVSEANLTLPVQNKHIEPMTLYVKWSEGVPETAVSIVLEPEGMETVEKTFWGSGDIETTISLND